MQVVWKALGARGGGGAAALLEGCIRGGMGHTLLSGGAAAAAMHEDASADHMARSVCLKVDFPSLSCIRQCASLPAKHFVAHDFDIQDMCQPDGTLRVLRPNSCTM
jgi:hypothetical protein